MSVAGQSETSNSARSTSVCPSTADFDQGEGFVSFVPSSDITASDECRLV